MSQTEYESEKMIDGFELAQKLRKEAQFLEDKEKIKRRLYALIEQSEDPYYDQYLKQMIKDLESGKATPLQVEREADRTYQLYLQRVGKAKPAIKENRAVDNMQSSKPKAKQPVNTKDTVEFKVGAGIFSTVGAVFVLAAFVIFGFNYLEGILQGICLYAASLVIILFSELLVKRISSAFSLVITGIGISSLFISTVINYMVLKNMNGLLASVITLVIAVGSILISRKKDAASIRLITIFGCYISFLPIKGFESEVSFLIMTGMLVMINLASIFLDNQSNKTIINCVHIVAHTIFTGVVVCFLVADGMNVLYSILFVVISLAILNLIFWRQKDDNKLWFTIVASAAIGCCLLILLMVVTMDHGMIHSLEIFYKVLAEIMAVAVAVIFFILWGQKEERWIQYYFSAAVIVLFNGFSDYKSEVVFSTLVLFAVTGYLSVKVKELQVLDAVIAVITTIQGLLVADEWYAVLFIIVMLLSSVLIRRFTLFHEINITVFWVVATIIGLDTDWSLPGSLLILLICFLLFNHLPGLRMVKQLPYNIINISFAGLLSLCSVFLDDYKISAAAMVIGVVIILIAFTKKYGLDIAHKYFILIGYLVYMIIVAEFKTPVIVSGLLMLVAILSIAVGFKKKDKSYRICGLILAVVVCVKLVLFDFGEIETLFKVILFLLVGVVALVISFLYIFLEKKDEEQELQQTIQQEIQDEKGML